MIQNTEPACFLKGKGKKVKRKENERAAPLSGIQ